MNELKLLFPGDSRHIGQSKFGVKQNNMIVRKNDDDKQEENEAGAKMKEKKI